MISETKVKRPIIFSYQPTEVRVGIWEYEGNYQIQVHGHGHIYTIATTETTQIAYETQKQAKQLLEKGAEIIITGAVTAKIGSLEELLKKQNKYK
jgi:hypothetical protein